MDNTDPTGSNAKLVKAVKTIESKIWFSEEEGRKFFLCVRISKCLWQWCSKLTITRAWRFINSKLSITCCCSPSIGYWHKIMVDSTIWENCVHGTMDPFSQQPAAAELLLLQVQTKGSEGGGFYHAFASCPALLLKRILIASVLQILFFFLP